MKLGRAHLSQQQQRIVDEIQRVARELDTMRLSQRQFDRHHQIGGVSTAGYQFGSWNRAVRAAGLEPMPSGQSRVKPQLTDDELLIDILRVQRDLARSPSEREMAAAGRYSLKPYKRRWGSFAAAKRVAYQTLGKPE